MKTSRPFIFLMLFSLLFLPGCWNSRELRDLAIVSGIGIDKVPDSNEYRVSLQIVNPNAVAGSKAGGGGQGMLPSIVYSSVDHTLFSAMRKTSQKVPRRLFYAHSQLFIIGETLAKEGINELFDMYERSHELRLNTSVVISRGIEAEALLNVLPPLQTTSAVAITNGLKVASDTWARSLDKDITDIVKSLSGSGEPIISGVRVVGDPNKGKKRSNLEQTPPLANLEVKGIAIFTDGKLTDWLEGKAARGAVWALNNMKSTIVNMNCDDKKEKISIEVIRSTTKLRTVMRNGKPVFLIQVKEEGNLSEALCPINPDKREVMVKLQKQLADETKKEIELAIKTTQQKKSDVFGFSTEMERTHPKEWKKMKKNWPVIYSQSEVEISVEAYIRRTGLRIKSYLKSGDG
ncbi:Ger(x)C family spore germination protein [Paenibacillus prosopidis]|uniref:Spore germination protein KC n=1 Tax=Paenibacillus prosopidis TaxID=630520 RepID=A0A368VW04_9BACL|nr:Ger(x)C family spore germination protein [Paenibacillus prosopidis]RCW45510.1 spore germination protein KC [Paenibacillus prosopidis]